MGRRAAPETSETPGHPGHFGREDRRNKLRTRFLGDPVQVTSLDCIFDVSLAPETCLEFPFLQISSRIRFGKLRPIPHWRFVPDHKHGPGTGDHWHGGKDLVITALRPRWGDL
jgi:hypothetical protein